MKRITSIILLALSLSSFAQNPEEDKIRTSNFPEIKKLKITDIPGAIGLSQPEWINGYEQDIRIEKHGLIYPALFDWNKDGKKDLLLGEFETSDTLSNIKVYLNEGTASKPKYSGKYFYATDINGTRIANSQWCCIGIHPRFVDITGDGYLDILSGQYNPGAISLWRGSKDGFLPREFVEQEGWQVEVGKFKEIKELRHGSKRGSAPWEPENLMYWNYTSADFGDFNGDGLLDLFVGGSADMRVALNIGTKENPKFGLRKYLYHVNGDILHIKKPTQEDFKNAESAGGYPNYSGTGKAYIKPIDWDNDGVLDLLMTNGYYKKGHHVVYFYKGVNTDKGLRFENYVSLFDAEDGSKTFPGVQPMLSVDDYNNDGINDLIIGVSIPTVNGFEADNKASWTWNQELGIQMPGKDAGRSIKYAGGFEAAKKMIEETPWKKKYYLGKLDDFKYLTLRHRGYVFVMYGTPANSKAVAKTAKAGEEYMPKKRIIDNVKGDSYDKVSYKITAPKNIFRRSEVSVSIKFDKGWHGYFDNEANKGEGFIPTKVEIEYPENGWLLPNGEMQMPKITNKGMVEVYKGEVVFKQAIKVRKVDTLPPLPTIDYDTATKEEIAEHEKKQVQRNEEFKKLPKPPGEFKLKVIVTWQTCDDNMCLPPQVVEEEFILQYGM